MRVGLLVLFASVRVAFADAQVAPASVDFGPVDVRGLAVTRTLTLTNGGDSAIDLGTATIAGSSAFVLTPPATLHVLAGQSVNATVAYHPTAEHADAATVTFVVTNQASITVPVAGRGIDRHMVVTPPAAVTAFRNASVDAAVTVSNTGEANLAISSVTLVADPVWQLVDADPVDVPGGTTYAVHVRFTPTVVGAAPLATLSLEGNAGSASVGLTGEGLARDVSLGPDLDLGYVGAGDALEGELAIENLDATNMFTVTQMTTSDASFVLAPPAQLAAGSAAPLQIVFRSDTPGDYTTSASLFLDADPVATDTVMITAHAVYVDAQGGGGCNAGGDAGFGLALVVLVGMVARRRVRVLLAVMLAPLVANADPRNLDVSIFDPTPSTAGTSFQLVTPAIGETNDVTASALLTYAAHPLVLSTPQADDAAIGSRMTLVLGGAWAVNDIVEIGAHVPMFVQSSDSVDTSMAAGTPAVHGSGFGNFTMHAKVRFNEQIAALASITAPTASGDRFAGQDNTSAHLLAVIALPVAPRVVAMLNFGAVARPESRFESYIERSGVAWGAGASYAWRPQITLDGELFGELVPGGHIDAMGNASMTATTELLLGARDRIDPWVEVGAALGRGVTGGPGSPAFRGLVTLTFMPSVRRLVHVVPPSFEDAAAPAAQLPTTTLATAADTDHDGIPDARDQCPTQPETINGNADDDGCPDEGDSLVTVGANALELRTPIAFAVGSQLDPASLNVLAQAAATLRAHPELQVIRVEVHVAASGDAAADLALSQHRADAVRNWLVQWGIAPARLESLGAGSDNEHEGDPGRVDLIEVH